MNTKIYLGDSVYADFDGYHVVLTTENGLPTDPSNTIALEPQVLAALNHYWNEYLPRALEPVARALISVGDIVRVGRECMGNAAGSRAVCYEVYELAISDDVPHRGVSLIFPNGRYDGFGPDDLDLCEVQKIGHAPSVAGYRFRNVIQLDEDFRCGVFKEAFTDAT